MKPTLFYTPGTCALSGIILLEWIETPYYLCRLEREDRRSAAYLRLNPLAQVPSFITQKGDFLTENAAILMHIADHDASQRFIPAHRGPQRDQLHRWLSYLDSGYHAAYYPLFKPQNFVTDEALYPGVQECAKEQVRKSLRYLSSYLDGREWFLGDTKSLLDGYMYAMGRWGRKFFTMEKEFPILEAYLRKMEMDPKVQLALEIEQGKLLKNESKCLQGHRVLEEFSNFRTQ